MIDKNRLLKHKFIILCGDHYNPLTLVRSLGLDGIEPVVVMIGDSYLVKASKFAKNFTRVNSVKEGLDYILQTYGNEQLKPFLFSCSDDVQTEYDARYDELKDKFYLFHGRKSGEIQEFMDKERILEAARECGIEVPDSRRLRLGEIPEDLTYPVITKSIRSTAGAWKQDVFICKNKEELKEAYTKIKSDPVLVEEFIEKKNELCLDGISFNGGETVYMPLKCNYLRFTPGAYGNYMLMQPFEDEELTKKITELFRKTGFTGIFSIEFLVTKDDRLKFLEINFRHSTWAITSRYAGANLPLLWAQSELDGRLDVSDVKLSREPFTALAELPDFNDHVRRGNMPLMKWIKDFRECPCTYVYDKRDKGPFRAQALHSAKQILKKIF